MTINNLAMEVLDYILKYSNQVITGVIASIMTVLVLTILKKLRLHWKLRGFNGIYHQTVNELSEKVNQDQKYEVRISFWKNLFQMNEKMTLKKFQLGKEQSWVGTYYIQNSNPFILNGIFKYSESTKWGYQNLYLNPKDEKIYIEADFKPSGFDEPFKYVITKMN